LVVLGSGGNDFIDIYEVLI